jgi:hypothetical protein
MLYSSTLGMSCGHTETAMALMDRADIGAKQLECTALHLACYNGHTEIMALSLNRGADKMQRTVVAGQLCTLHVITPH